MGESSCCVFDACETPILSDQVATLLVVWKFSPRTCQLLTVGITSRRTVTNRLSCVPVRGERYGKARQTGAQGSGFPGTTIATDEGSKSHLPIERLPRPRSWRRLPSIMDVNMRGVKQPPSPRQPLLGSRHGTSYWCSLSLQSVNVQLGSHWTGRNQATALYLAR